jgi:hypothetical protein
MLQEIIARELNIPVGHYYHHAGSLHIYDRHFFMNPTKVIETSDLPLWYRFNHFWDDLEYDINKSKEQTWLAKIIKEYNINYTEFMERYKENYDEHITTLK